MARGNKLLALHNIQTNGQGYQNAAIEYF